MAQRGFGMPQPDPRANPFANQPNAARPPYGASQPPQAAPYPQARREYGDVESDTGDYYGSTNSSTTRLAGAPGYSESNCMYSFHDPRLPA
jgi:1,3-beta-glucan synthase